MRLFSFVFLVVQLLPPPAPASTSAGVSFSGHVKSDREVRLLLLLPVDGGTDQAVSFEVSPGDGSFAVRNLPPKRYRLAAHPPLEPDQRVQIDVQDLDGELLVYSPGQSGPTQTDASGVSQTWKFGVGGSAVLGAAGVGGSYTRNQGGGAEFDTRDIAQLVLEFRLAAGETNEGAK